jgi:hypothetical protein
VAIDYYLRNTNTDATCDAGAATADYDLNKTQGSGPNSVGSGTFTSTSWVEYFTWDLVVSGDSPATGTHTVKVEISVATKCNIRWRIQEVSSGCSVLNSSGYSTTYSTIGTKSDSLTLTWSTGDRLRLSVEAQHNAGGHGNATFSINTEDADSDVVAPWTVGVDYTEEINEAVAISEDVRYLMSRFRRIDETVSISEAIEAHRRIATAINEGVATAEDVRYLLTLLRTINESVNIGEDVRYLLTLIHSIEENVNISEAIEAHRVIMPTIDEVVQIAESIEAHVARTAAIDEGVSIGEALSYLLTRLHWINETVSIGENLTKVLGFVKTIDETVSITEGIEYTLERLHEINEGVNISESILSVMRYARTIDEAVAIGETIQASVAYARRVDETISISESIQASMQMVRRIDEGVAVSESLDRVLGFVRSIDETVSISESLEYLLTGEPEPEPEPEPEFIQQTFKLMVNPDNYLTVLGAIANDGHNYEVAFDNGTYPGSTLYINHCAGGRITFKAFIPRQAYIGEETDGITGTGSFEINVNAKEFHCYGMVLRALPYDADLAATFSTNRRTITVNYDNTCEPEEIVLANNLCLGDNAGFTLHPSNDPTVYTDIRLYDNEGLDAPSFVSIKGLVEIGHSYYGDSLSGGSTATMAFAHIQVWNHRSECRAGPDGVSWGGVTSQHHGNRTTMGLEVRDLAGNSTYTERGGRYKSIILGSNNHDMHCQRINFTYTKGVRYYWYDCRFIGEWQEGHQKENPDYGGAASGQEAGGNLWVWYHHQATSEYDTNDSEDRPNMTFENCYFKQHIFPGVPTVEGTHAQGAGNLGLQVVSCLQDGTYNFYDCTIEIEDEVGFYTTPGDKDVHFGKGIVLSGGDAGDSQVSAELNTHNLIFTTDIDPGVNPDPVPVFVGRVGAAIPPYRVHNDDAISRGFIAPEYARVVPREGLIQTGDTLATWSFEPGEDEWEDLEGAPGPVNTEQYDQDYSMRLRTTVGTLYTEATGSPLVNEATEESRVYRLTYWANWKDIRTQTVGSDIDFMVAYSIDNGAWVDFYEFDPTSIGDDDWHFYDLLLDVPAHQYNVRIRFRNDLVTEGAEVKNYYTYLDLVQLEAEGDPP